MLAPRQPTLTSLPLPPPSPLPPQALLIRPGCRSGRIQWLAGGFAVSQYLYLLAVIMLIRWLTRLGLFTASPLQGIVVFFPSHPVLPFSSLTCFSFFLFLLLFPPKIVACHWLLCPIQSVLHFFFFFQGKLLICMSVHQSMCTYIIIFVNIHFVR